MKLENKNAIVYGAGGAIGSAVAIALAADGAKVFLAGRSLESLENTASFIRSNGGHAEVSAVDALNEESVDLHFKSVIEKSGKVDISVNATGTSQLEIQGTSLLEITPEKLLQPITSYVKSNFITARTAGKFMKDNGEGVIISFTAPPGKLAVNNYGGMPAAWAALESLNRTFASELGTCGIRVVCLRVSGMPETSTIADILKQHAQGGVTPQQIAVALTGMTLLKRLPTLSQLANTAAFIASDDAGAFTGTTLNLSVGIIAD